MLSIGINLGWGCDTEKIEIMSSSTITRRYKYVKTIMYKTFVFSVVIILRQKAKRSIDKIHGRKTLPYQWVLK